MCGILCFATTSCQTRFEGRIQDEIYSASWISEVGNIILEFGDFGSKVIFDIGDYSMTEEDYKNLKVDTAQNYKYVSCGMRSLYMEVYYCIYSYNSENSTWEQIEPCSLLQGEIKYYGDYFIFKINEDLLFNYQYKTIRFNKITD